MATKRKKAKPKSRSKFRASWRGQLRFGLVSFEVQAVNAEIKENAEVHFHLLHEPDHERIHYAKVCPKHGEVPNDEIVEGYEYAKGKYVEFDKEELDTLRSVREKALTIDAFVSSDEVDPIYFDGRMYYLIPSGASASEPYCLLEAAMEKKGRWGVGQVVFSGREQLALVRPLDGVLTMAMLNYDAEIRKPADFKTEFTRAHTTPRKLKLAEELVGKWHEGKFDFSEYKDNYRKKVKQAIEAKEKGIEIEAPEEEEGEVINLMDALQRSVAHAGKNGTAHTAHHARNGKAKSTKKKGACRPSTACLIMGTSNAQIADLLRRYATVLVLEGADRFKIKAYRRAAETIETLKQDAAKLVSRGEDLKQLPAIGTAISATIEQIVKTGGLPQLKKALGKLEPGLVELATKPALDPTKVKRIYKKLGITSLNELKERLDSGEIREILGARLDYHVRQGLDERPRMLLWAAQKLVPAIEEQLTQCGATQAVATGSLRRKKDTIGDLGFLVTGKSAATIFKRFAQFATVHAQQSKNKSEKRFRLSEDRTVNLTFTPAAQWGLALLNSSGSAAHLDALKIRTAKLKTSFSAKALGKHASDEAAVYKALRLDFIEPELRENRGELEAAAADSLPELVQLEDLRGDLHMHTTESDGADPLQTMMEAAKERGYEYIAITDHSQSLKITNGLTEKRLFQQIKAIDKLNAKLKGLTVLKSSEVDILEDGRLDFSNAALKELDLTICSIHSRFALNKQQQTERIMRAMDNPYFSILGHATGRLLLKREGYEIDMERLIKHARQRGCFFEINSSPDRLDLSDEHAKMAKDAGIKIAINTDAHSTRELRFISAGVNQARRGWLEPMDVLNTYSLPKLRAQLRH